MTTSFFDARDNKKMQLQYFCSVIQHGEPEQKHEMIQLLLRTPVNRLQEMMDQHPTINSYCLYNEAFSKAVSENLRNGKFIGMTLESNDDFIMPVQLYIAMNQLKAYQDLTVVASSETGGAIRIQQLNEALKNLDLSCEAKFYDALLTRCQLNVTVLENKNSKDEKLLAASQQFISDLDKLKYYMAPGFVQAASFARKFAGVLKEQKLDEPSQKWDKVALQNYLCALELFQDKTSNQILAELTQEDSPVAGWEKFTEGSPVQFDSLSEARETIEAWVKACGYDLDDMKKAAHQLVERLFSESPTPTILSSK